MKYLKNPLNFFSKKLKKLFPFSDLKLLFFVTKKFIKHCLIFFCMWIYQKWSNILGKKIFLALFRT